MYIVFRFTLVDVGEAGRQSDGGVFSNSSLGQALESEQLSIPKASPLPHNIHQPLPYVIVGDEAFPLKSYMLRPYPGRFLPGMKKQFISSCFAQAELQTCLFLESTAILNYRLSRARRLIENTFASRWRIFRTSIIPFPTE